MMLSRVFAGAGVDGVIIGGCDVGIVSDVAVVVGMRGVAVGGAIMV